MSFNSKELCNPKTKSNKMMIIMIAVIIAMSQKQNKNKDNENNDGCNSNCIHCQLTKVPKTKQENKDEGNNSKVCLHKQYKMT